MTPCELVEGDFRWHGTCFPWCRTHGRKASDCMTALEGELAAAKRGRKEAEDTVEALRADLEEERRYRDRAENELEAVRKIAFDTDFTPQPSKSARIERICALLSGPAATTATEATAHLAAKATLAAVQREVELWTSYAEHLEDSHQSMQRIEALLSPRMAEPDPLHPTGRCSCGGEGRCDWCLAHPDPYPEEAPDAEGVAEVLQDTQAYIESCLNAKGHLDAVREVVRQYNDPGNETFGSLVAMQKVTELLAASTGAADSTYLRDALGGTEDALRDEMRRCRAAEAKLSALKEAIENTTVGEWRDMTGYKRLHALVTSPALPKLSETLGKIEAVRAFARECRSCTGYGDPEVIRIFRGLADRLDALLATPGGSSG